MEAPRTHRASPPPRRRRGPAVVVAGGLAAALFLSGAAAAQVGLFDVGNGIRAVDAGTGQPVDAVIRDGQWQISTPSSSPTATTAPPTSTPPTSTPPTSTPDTSSPLGLNVDRTGDGTRATVTVASTLTQATVGRDGRDTAGTGAWTSPVGATFPYALTKLDPGAPYRVTVTGLRDGVRVSASIVVPGRTATASPTGTPTTAAPSPTSAPPTTTAPPSATGFPALQTGSLSWISGAAGESVAGGQFAAYRGTPVRIAATWLGDTVNASTLTFSPGKEYGAWRGSLDVGYRGVTSPSQWASCATGACDARWRADLTTLRQGWESTDRGDGAFFLRLAWEMNGNWFQHSVNGSDTKSFATAWARFSELRKQVFPEARMVFSANRDTSPSRFDWRTAVPGYVPGQAGTVARYVDVMNVDYYSEYASKADSVADFQADAMKIDQYGAPVGIERHRQLAAQFGLPFSVGEWSTVLEGDQSSGDNPALIQGMHAFFTKNAGAGAGQLLYEIQFSARGAANGKFVLGPNTRMPRSSQVYADLF